MLSIQSYGNVALKLLENGYTPIPIVPETKIIQDELHVKGDICVYEEWFATGDIVKLENKRFWFHSRKNEFRCDNLRHN